MSAFGQISLLPTLLLLKGAATENLEEIQKKNFFDLLAYFIFEKTKRH